MYQGEEISLLYLLRIRMVGSRIKPCPSNWGLRCLNLGAWGKGRQNELYTGCSKLLPKGGVFFSSSWLGLDAISAAEQGSLAGSNFLIRTPGLLAGLFPALTPLLRNRTPQASR